ncbi:MAG: ankyrin repeat domain-containing protein [Leptospiraceae bacterium]|nr:ankyrin repeat domain-containing protein [Leptospiraceae bacterium]MBK7056646.1 ankyrin repeat domain-containing protein [Leptospiraceae bacterium]MBP9164859.1 ankyrin repeat domain-containing protein [Leptospiraceae bacterium]
MMKWLISLFSTNKEKQLLPSDLHYACGEEGSIETLAKLLESKPDLEKKDAQRKTPLFWAIENGRLDCFELLLQSGANPNAQDEDGVTCLNIALSSNGLSEFSDALKRFNVDPTIKDKHGKLYLM